MVETLVGIISAVGFPVVACIALFWYLVQQNAAHKEETEKLRFTLAENTRVLLELTNLIKALNNGNK